MSSKKKIPKELVHLIRSSVKLLGEVLKEALGEKSYERIETLRISGKNLTSTSSSANWKKQLDQIQSWTAEQRLEVAHAFGLMLELINCCETAYRTHRLRQYKPSLEKQKSNIQRIEWVLTAHPTEARSPATLALFQEIQYLLIENLDGPDPKFSENLKSLLHLAWHASLSKLNQPSVKDEADNIYSILLRPELIDQILKLHEDGHPLYFTTWVGGDKDGHPGVDQNSMLASWNLSRSHLVNICRKLLLEAEELFKKILDNSFNSKLKKTYLTDLQELQKLLNNLNRLKQGDGEKLKAFTLSLKSFEQKLFNETKINLRQIKKLRAIIQIFPGLVVPLELREEASFVKEAITRPDLSIAKMLKTLAGICGTSDPRNYARALVLSQTEALADLQAGWDLAKVYFAKQNLPVVPLLESEKALKQGPQWIEKLSGDPSRLKILKQNFNSSFEVMLGYSDSAKESGSLSSRFLIFESLERMEKSFKQLKLQPIFFHGSGGSVSRGGGPIKEQMSWWSPSALKYFKATLQGEMIQRTFATPEILQSQIHQISHQSALTKQYKMPRAERDSLNRFQTQVQTAYRKIIENPEFLHAIEVASPYSFLHHLKIGSRPNKRKGPLSVKSLRAIPWVLCWTQMRALLQVWWGVGQAWNQLSSQDKKILKSAANKNPLLMSYMHMLGFTLAKIELSVFNLYLQSSDLTPKAQKQLYDQFCREYNLTATAFRQITGKKDFLWLRPWLGDSIKWRSPMIHPLNLLQITALKNEETLLLRETVTGIASGMMTTG